MVAVVVVMMIVEDRAMNRAVAFAAILPLSLLLCPRDDEDDRLWLT